MAGSPWMSAMLILCMLVLGSWNTLNVKLQQESCAPTLDLHPTVDFKGDCGDSQKLFRKPWTQNILMFVAEATMLIPYTIQKKGRRQTAREVLVPPAVEAAPKVPFYVFAVPAFCDVFGTGLGSVSMLFLDSAIWQMLRSSIIICSAVLSVTFLRKRLQPFHWLAVCIVFVGLVLVGLATMLDAADKKDDKKSVSADKQLIGIVLVISAQLCAAFQMVFEEKLLTGRAKTSAKKTVGMEGCWGMAFMTMGLIVMGLMPGPDNGSYESFIDGAYMIGNDGLLLFFVLTYMASISMYNFVGITVGKKMSAVVRCLVDSCRTVVVWAVNLLLFAMGSPYGSEWTRHSWLTAFGFLWLVFGTLLYNAVFPVPAFLTRPADPGEEDNVCVSVAGSFAQILSKADMTDETSDSEAARSRDTLHIETARH